MTPNDVPLTDFPSSQQTKNTILDAVFGSRSTENFQPFFQYYSTQCRQIAAIFLANGSQFPFTAHSDVLEIVRDIRNRVPPADIISKLSTKYPDVSEAALENAIDLSMRVLLMADVGCFENAYTGRDCILRQQESVDELVQRVFGAEPKLNCDAIKLDADMSALNLERIGGFTVMLTTNLADHLRWREELRTVSIFHHATFLQHHQGLNPVFPDGFIDETLQTLALLFPRGDQAVVKWYQRKAPAEELDLAVLKCGATVRQIEHYRFWRDRLVQLKEALDYSRPRNLRQWWHDRRDGLQWYSLWIAVLFTVLFGLVQSIEGAIQLTRQSS